MSASAFQSYRDLLVWQAAMVLATDCYAITGKFPREELFGLTSQIRPASASIPANIAEGHGRQKTGSFFQFFRIAQGSTKELQTRFLLAERFLKQDSITPSLERCNEVGKMLRSLIRSLQGKEQPR